MKQADPPSPPREPAGCGLVLMRHGESEWNAKNLFTGWANPPLTAAGERDAIRAGHLLAARGLLPAAVHTSLQRRAIRTAELALAACDCDWIGVYRSWRLNGRHYGALQGRDKSQVRAEYGDAQLMRWRRSFDVPPPPLAPGARHSQFGDPRYASLPPEARPSGESLRDVTGRLLPYWYDVLVPQLRTGTNVLVVSHGNTLRALVKHLDSITDEDIMAVDVPNAVPLLYQFDDRMRPLTPGARYLSGMGTSPGSP